MTTAAQRRQRILAELHPLLAAMVGALLDDLGGRFMPICGYRDEAAQADALARHASNAAWGQSPHNFKPALACDLVLNPEVVAVTQREGFPDLWDEKSPGAVEAWNDLEVMAAKHGLERVCITDRITGKPRRDKPHVQLPGWRTYIPH